LKNLTVTCYIILLLLFNNLDAHYIPVCPKNPDNPNEVIYLATKSDQVPVYDELVIFQRNSIIPRFIVYYELNDEI
jgi:hypothetical protein